MKLRLIYSIFFNLVNILVFSQNDNLTKIDSLKSYSRTIGEKSTAKIYTQIAEHFSENDSIIFYYNKALTLFQKENDLNNMSYIYYGIGVAYMSFNLDESILNIKKSLKLANKVNNDSLKSLNYLAIATYFTHIPKTDSSIYYITKATKYFIEVKDSTSLIYCYHNLMSNYNDVNNTKKTIEYGQLALNLAIKKNETAILGNIRIALGFIYAKNGMDSLAMVYINKAIDDANATNNKNLLIQIFLTLGAKNYKNNKLKEAIIEYQKVFEISKEQKEYFFMNLASFHLGQIYFKLNDNKIAEKYLLRTLLFERNTTETLKNSYLYLSMIYTNKNIDKQNHYFSKFDSISKFIEKINSEELLIKYEAAEKEKQIDVLNLNEVENELIIQKNKANTILLFSILSISIILLILLFYRYKVKQKILNQNLEIEKQKSIQSKIYLLQKEREIALKIDALKNNNLIIEELKIKLEKASSNDEKINYIINSFDQNYVSEKQWDNIITHFNTLENKFISDLKESHPNISKNDIKLSILMKLNYSNSGMAEIMNISLEGVKKAKQRLKKKLSVSI